MGTMGLDVVQGHNRRNWPRVVVRVPVTLTTAAADDGEDVCLGECRVRDVGPGGLYILTRRLGVFAPGQLLRVSVGIPWEMRARLPFSRLMGIGRIVRIDETGEDLSPGERGLAVSFCGEITTLGAIMTPQ